MRNYTDLPTSYRSTDPEEVTYPYDHRRQCVWGIVALVLIVLDLVVWLCVAGGGR